MNTQVHCTPSAEFLVLDTRTPSTSFVKDFSLSRKKDESVTGADALVRDANEFDVVPKKSAVSSSLPAPPKKHVPTTTAANVRPTTPIQTPRQDSSDLALLGSLLDSRSRNDSPSLPDAESPFVASNSESVIVQNELHQDGFLGDDILPDPFLGELELDSSPFQDRIRECEQDLDEQDSELSSTLESPDPNGGASLLGSSLAYNLNRQDSDQPASILGSPNQESGVSPLGTFLPRKRSAKAASLPDSVTDSERGYSRVKKPAGEPSFPSTPSPIKQSHSTSFNSNLDSHQRSLIPRPRSNLSHGNSRSESSKDSLTPSLPPSLPTSLSRGKAAPVIEADFRRFEDDVSPLFRDCKAIKKGKEKDPGLHHRVSKHKDGSPNIHLSTRSPVTPSKSNHQARDGNPRTQSDLEKLSTVATIGSPCDFTGLPGDSDDIDNADKTSFSVSPGQSGAFVLVQPLPIWFTENNSTDGEREPEPRLTFTTGRFYIVSPPRMTPAAYQVKITLSVPLQDSRPGWRELVVTGLPRLPPDEHGYVYFVIPQEVGLEFRTSHLRRYKIVEGCLMGQMLISSRLILPLRPCHSNFFGYLNDFNVGQEIDMEILSDNDSFRVVRYHATCSINLINTDFWAERCGLWLYIHGGPQGDFCCSMQKPGFQDVNLRHPGNGIGIGVSRVEILACRSNLDKFAITWEVRIVKGSPIRMPRIRSNEYNEAGFEDELREEPTQVHNPESVRAEAIYKGSGVERLLTGTKEEVPCTTSTSTPRTSRFMKCLNTLNYFVDIFRWFYLIVWFKENYTRYKMDVPFYYLKKKDPETWCAGRDSDCPWQVYVPACPEIQRLANEIAEARLNEGDYRIHCEIDEDPPAVRDCSIVLLPGLDHSGEAHILVDMEEPVPGGRKNESDIETVSVSGSGSGSVSLRDRIDYFLGWQGPVGARGL